MKSYTDLNQSRKLAEILPIESADMFYVYDRHLDKLYGDIPYVIGYKTLNENVDIPCWSLSALLVVVSEEVGLNSFKDGNWNAAIMQQNGKMLYVDKDNPVDACVELIIKLYKQKRL